MASDQPTVIDFSTSGTQYQSIQDFEMEQDELQAQLDQNILNEQLKKFQSVSSAAGWIKNASEEATLVLRKRQALEEMGDINWVGRLQEYHQAKGINSTPEYTEKQISIDRFSCFVSIRENPQLISSNVMFSRKKDAKQFIAKLAIDWLITQNLMPSNGDVKFPKAPVTPQTPQRKPSHAPISCQATSTTSSPSERSTSPSSYPGLIPSLCHTLGFNVPTYKIVPIAEGIPIYQGYADFGSDPRVLGKVGEFRDIHGKKKAKEVCAKEVWIFLKDIERQRLERIEDAEVKKTRNREETPRSQSTNGEVRVVAGI